MPLKAVQTSSRPISKQVIEIHTDKIRSILANDSPNIAVHLLWTEDNCFYFGLLAVNHIMGAPRTQLATSKMETKKQS